MMLKALITPGIIACLVSLSLGLIWYETIVQWTYQENMKFYMEHQCYKPDTFCESQNPVMMMSMLGIVVVGMMTFTYCYSRFNYMITERSRT